MKKILVSLGIAGLLLVGCSEKNESEKETKNTEVATSTEKSPDVTYKDDTITTPKGIIKFDKSEVHTHDPSGEKIIVLLFDYTNTTNEGIQAVGVLDEHIKVKQVLDSTTTELEYTMLSDSDSSIQMAKDATDLTNAGATIKGASAYMIKDETKPVTIDILDENQKVIGTKEILINK